MENVKNSPDNSNRELRISRLLRAPRELVWQVFTQPEHIVNWWGPNGFTNTIQTMQVRPGGVWDLTMHGPDGTDYKNKSVYREIVQPERIVYEHISGPKFIATIELLAEGENTRLNWHMLFESAEELEQVIKVFKADEGLKQNAEKLADYVNRQPVIVERLLNAPAARVWLAITQKSEMKNWYFDLAEFRAEPGFVFEFTGGADPGIQYVHICEITEVIAEKKLTYSWRYKGYAGISYVSFELFPQGGKTLLRLTHTGIDSFPADNGDFAKHNFIMGWNQIINTSLPGYLE